MDGKRVAPQRRLPDVLWGRMEPLEPRLRRNRKGGRPWVANRASSDGIFYELRTGCQWNAVPREFGAGKAIFRIELFGLRVMFELPFFAFPAPGRASLPGYTFQKEMGMGNQVKIIALEISSMRVPTGRMSNNVLAFRTAGFR